MGRHPDPNKHKWASILLNVPVQMKQDLLDFAKHKSNELRLPVRVTDIVRQAIAEKIYNSNYSVPEETQEDDFL